MKDPKVAIIIPAYNAGKMLGKSLESVLAQTYRHLEVWVTDDGSKDDTGEEADRFAAKDARVRVIHQENCGCYQARLNALKRIDAPYFAFADADDTLEPDMIERMVDLAESEHLDVVQCAHYEGVRVRNVWSGEMVLPDRFHVYRDFIFPQILEGRDGCFVWNKLYRNQYDFKTFDPTDKDTNYEDLIFNFQFFLPVTRMGFINDPLYHYELVDGSAVHSFSQSKIKDFREACRVRSQLAPQYGLAADSPTMSAWVRHNARNGVLTASMASFLKVDERAAFVRQICLLPEVVHACKRCPTFDRDKMFLALARGLPGRMFQLMICVARWMKGRQS